MTYAPPRNIDIAKVKADDSVTDDIKKLDINEDVKKDLENTETETVQPEQVVTPNTTTTQPVFSRNERIGYTLLPLASALLQGKRSGSGSMFGDTLASLGRGS